MNLSRMARAVSGKIVNAEASTEISGALSTDTRTLKPGDLFVAIAGSDFNGAEFVSRARELGAGACVVTKESDLGGMPGVVVTDTRKAVSTLAALWAGEPAKEMVTIGVTGTNGKTTTNWLIYHALNLLGLPTLRSGTLGAATPQGSLLPETLTTPDAVTLHGLLARSRAEGIRCAVFEVSAHALAQHRADGLELDVGIFTNLTRDHLDYFENMENYLAAKSRLFELVNAAQKRTKAAVINIEDEAGRNLALQWRKKLRLFSFGRRGYPDLQPDIEILSFSQSVAGSTLRISAVGAEEIISSCYIGEHNAENIAGAVGALLALQYPLKSIAAVFPHIPPVPGRLEPVPSAKLGVFVDYAHTPDALVRAIAAVKPLTTGKLHVLFGCGGDRDRGKRPQMLKASLAGADRVIVTSDNPRTEDPLKIISDILVGNTAPVVVKPDRREAIRAAISAAMPGDVILVAGKGHEDYQIIGTTKHHFSDVEECARALKEYNTA